MRYSDKQLNAMTRMQFKNTFFMDQDLRIDIADNMTRWGGSFVKSLASCVILADHINRKKIVHTFYDYCFEYAHDHEVKGGA